MTKTSPLKAANMQIPTGSFSIYNIQYVTIALATLFNFAHGVLYLRPLVYYSRCLLFFFYYIIM